MNVLSLPLTNGKKNDSTRFTEKLVKGIHNIIESEREEEDEE